MSKIFRCDVCKSEPAIANTRETGQFWCETCQTWKPILMIYTFTVDHQEIPKDVKVGNRITWMQMRPNVGSYGNQRSGGPEKEITGVVIDIDDLWVRVEAEFVPAINR